MPLGVATGGDTRGADLPRMDVSIGHRERIGEADLGRDGSITSIEFDLCIADDGRTSTAGVIETVFLTDGVRNSVGADGRADINGVGGRGETARTRP